MMNRKKTLQSTTFCINWLMKTYEGIFDPNMNDGVYAISLVKSPAMRGNFIALKDQSKIVQFKTVDAEKQVLVGLVLQPDFPVYRNQDGEEFEVFFTAPTVEALAHNFFKQSYQNNSTIEHSKSPISGVSFVESWIVESDQDKQSHFGFSYPVGSWLVKMKIDDKKLWAEYIKSGKVLGFSIDAFVNLKPVTNKNEIKMNEVLEAIKTGFADFTLSFMKTVKTDDVDVKLGEVKSGELTLKFDGEAMVVGEPIWTEVDGEKIPLPVGEYPIEGDRKLVVAEDGFIGSLIEDETSPDTPQKPNDDAAMSNESAKGVIDAIKSIMIKYNEDVEKFVKENQTKVESENLELANKVKELENEIIKLGEESAATIPATPAKVKKYADMTNKEKLEFNRSK